MAEIRYRDYTETANLSGKSVAEVRQRFKEEFGIPEKAKARLNGKKIKGKYEAETCLNDGDRLTFARSGGKWAIMAGAVLLTLALTGGVFAFTATTDTATLGMVAYDDFVTVTSNLTGDLTGDTHGIYGKYKGALPEGNLFNIEPADGYPGDLVVTVSLGNGDDMVNVYRVFVMNIEVVDSLGASCSDGILTLSNGELELAIDVSATSGPYYVRSSGGFYVSHGWDGFWTPGGDEEDPVIYCDVAQR